MRAFNLRSFFDVAAASIALGSPVHAAVTADMTTPPGTTATVTITVTIDTAFGTDTDSDTKTMATTGTSSAAFQSDTPPFSVMQLNAFNLGFATTTFNFEFYCLPFIGCQELNATISNLSFSLQQPTCSPIAPGSGAVTFNDAQMLIVGAYSTTGVATASGQILVLAPADFSGRIQNPPPGPNSVLFDQLAIQDQTFEAPKDQLPSGVNSLVVTIHAVLTSTTFSGSFNPSAEDFDADNDGSFDGCDPCTDTDGDGFGDPEFFSNTCAADNCPFNPNPAQGDHDLDGYGDLCDCLADIAPFDPGPPVIGGDGQTNVDDLLVVINSWGLCPDPPAPGSCLADIAPINGETIGDGMVNIDDLLAIINAWGTCP